MVLYTTATRSAVWVLAVLALGQVRFASGARNLGDIISIPPTTFDKAIEAPRVQTALRDLYVSLKTVAALPQTLQTLNSKDNVQNQIGPSMIAKPLDEELTEGVQQAAAQIGDIIKEVKKDPDIIGLTANVLEWIGLESLKLAKPVDVDAATEGVALLEVIAAELSSANKLNDHSIRYGFWRRINQGNPDVSNTQHPQDENSSIQLQVEPDTPDFPNNLPETPKFGNQIDRTVGMNDSPSFRSEEGWALLASRNPTFGGSIVETLDHFSAALRQDILPSVIDDSSNKKVQTWHLIEWMFDAQINQSSGSIGLDIDFFTDLKDAIQRMADKCDVAASRLKDLIDLFAGDFTLHEDIEAQWNEMTDVYGDIMNTFARFAHDLNSVNTALTAVNKEFMETAGAVWYDAWGFMFGTEKPKG